MELEIKDASGKVL